MVSMSLFSVKEQTTEVHTQAGWILELYLLPAAPGHLGTACLLLPQKMPILSALQQLDPATFLVFFTGPPPASLSQAPAGSSFDLHNFFFSQLWEGAATKGGKVLPGWPLAPCLAVLIARAQEAVNRHMPHCWWCLGAAQPENRSEHSRARKPIAILSGDTQTCLPPPRDPY